MVEIKQPQTEFSENENPKPLTSISEAKEVVKQLKEQNDRYEQLVKRQEELSVENMLGGRSAASVQQEQPKEETPEEYKNRVMRGGL
jgi:hypothetical protein